MKNILNNIYNAMMKRRIKSDFILFKVDGNESCIDNIVNQFLKYKCDSNNRLKLVIISEYQNKVFDSDKHNGDIKIIDNVSGKYEQTIYSNAIAAICTENDIEIAWKYGTAIIVNDSLKNMCVQSNSGLYYTNYDEFIQSIDMLYDNCNYRAMLASDGRRYIECVNNDKYIGVCILSKNYLIDVRNGIKTPTYELAHELSETGHNVHIIVNKNEKITEPLKGKIHLHYIKATNCDFLKLPQYFKTTRRNIEYSYAAYIKIKEITSQYRIDIIEAPLHGGEAFVKSLEKNPPLVVRLEKYPSDIIKTMDNECMKDAYLSKAIETETLKNADMIIVDSYSTKQLVCKNYGIDGKLDNNTKEQNNDKITIEKTTQDIVNNYKQLVEKRNKINFSEACERYANTYELLDNVGDCVDFQNKNVLDVGCGTGNGLIALMKKGVDKAVGVDINLDEFGYNYFKEIAQIQNVSLDKIALIEGNICNDDLFREEMFDIIISLDTFEHIDNPEIALNNCEKVLKTNGYIIIAISPLYYSPIGSHLWPYFPKETEPWAHLRYKDITKIKDIDEWHLKHFHHLNKLTLDDMRNYIKKLNLEIVLESIESSGRDMYEKYATEIDLNKVPRKDDLFTESVIYVLKKDNR